MSSATTSETVEFQSINRGYNSVFHANRLSLGLVVPIENYGDGPIPEMHRHIERVQLAEALGFSAVWLRDVPFNVPAFGDAGQTYDPFVYLGLLSGLTERIALGVASIILPLRHPAHVAKAAATADVLSGGRLILGVASGDRPEEYPAINAPFVDRGASFRESYRYIRKMSDPWPRFDNQRGRVRGEMDMLPKPVSGRLPLLITGSSQQSPEWLAAHGDGWMTYPRPAESQARVIQDWRQRMRTIGRPNQPVLQPLYIDLTEPPDTPPTPIHLGLRIGINPLREYLRSRQEMGINHIALNLRFNRADIESTLKRIADELLPEFQHEEKKE